MMSKLRNRPSSKPHLQSSDTREFLSLDDLKDTDVVFGTRGNGGNSSFIRTLEDKAVMYTTLSKFEKMDCIKDLINDWGGRFFMIGPDGICSMVNPTSCTPSSKLYTSVRRMMNYVVKKNETTSSGDDSKQNQRCDRKKREIQKPVVRSKKRKLLATVTPDLQQRPGECASSTETSPLDSNIIVELEEAAIRTLTTLSNGASFLLANVQDI